MRKKMRFQTRLMLAMSLTIVVVLVALLIVTENRVRSTYIRHFASDFQKQVEQLKSSRDERTKGYLELCATLAKDLLPVNMLKGKKKANEVAAFWETYKEAYRELSTELFGGKAGPRPPSSLDDSPDRKGDFPPGPDLFQRIGFVGVMDLKGNVTPISNPLSATNRRFSRQRLSFPESDIEAQLSNLPQSSHQQIGYFPTENPEGKTGVQEIIATPVTDPETGQLLGLFLRGNSSETSTEKFLERYNQEFKNEAGLRSGIYLDGIFYSKELEPEFSVAIGDSIHNQLDGDRGKDGAIEFDFGGEPYRVQYEALNMDSTMPTAYQAIVFPLAQLHSDLKDLRLRGSGIGIFAILLGLAISAFLSRNLAVPIRELSEGTHAIREGDFDTRVRVRSEDEIGELAKSFNSMAEELKQKALYRDLLGKVSDEAVAQAMISGSLDLELGGEIKEVSVLFCDIRNFTDLTEKMNPSDVIDLLNNHMTAMTRIVREHYGVVDKFIGDEIMALFGALKSYDNDAENAARCALEMIAERERLNVGIKTPIEIGVGVATGEIVAGCMGSVDRLNYTVLGARVNLASRLCNAAGGMEALIDDNTHQKIKGAISSEDREDISLKGFSNSIHTWRLKKADAKNSGKALRV